VIAHTADENILLHCFTISSVLLCLTFNWVSATLA
jgi:hypothetical protein